MSKGTRKNAGTAEGMEGEVRSSGIQSEPGSEMMVMLRALLEEQRRSELAREEARREERKEEARVEREIEATRLQIEQQKALETRQYEQQVALLKIQAEIGEKASRAHREVQSSERKRDRALFSIPVLKEGEDLEEFLLTAERRLRAAEIKQEEWVPIIDSRLSGKMASAWQDITITVAEYQEAKGRLLTMCGYTRRLAADSFFGFKMENSKGLTADQLYHRGQQLLRRMIAPGRATEEVEFSILRGWVGTVISKKARAAVDARVVTNATELINALQDFLVLEGDHSEGQTAIFRRSESSKDRVTTLTCFKCGKVGHKAIVCWTGKGGASAPKTVTSVSGGVASKIICYTCGEEGHKSPQCPKQIKGEKTGSKDFKAKPVKRLWRSQPKCVQLGGVVNGHDTPILLDSGAAISVVPESLVEPRQLSGNSVAVKPFGAKKPMLLPTAELSFRISNLEWVECVAVAPKEEGAESEVLYSLDLQSKRGLELVLIANKVDQRDVLRVTTHAQARVDKQEEEEEAAALAVDVPSVNPLPSVVSTRHDVITDVICEPEAVVVLEKICTEAGSLDRKEEESEKEVLGRKEEEFEESLGIEEDSYVEGEEEGYRLREESREEPELVVPPVKAGNRSRATLVAETKSDPSLEKWRSFAEKGEKGFVWRDGLLYQSVTTHVLESVYVMVLPK